MKYIKAMMLSMVVALGCCLGVAASASAEGGPLYGFLEGGIAYLLRSNETLNVLASAATTQLLGNSAAVVQCTVLKLLSGAYLLGGSPGKDFEQILYSGCTVPGSSSCDVLSPGQPLGSIQTEPLESELVFLEKEAAKELNPDVSGTLFRPAPPVTKFATLEGNQLTTNACPSSLRTAKNVEGEVILKNDEPLTHLVSHLLLAPKSLIKTYNLGVSGTEHAIKTLEAFGLEAKYLGATLVNVTLLHSSTNLSWWLCP